MPEEVRRFFLQRATGSFTVIIGPPLSSYFESILKQNLFDEVEQDDLVEHLGRMMDAMTQELVLRLAKEIRENTQEEPAS
jgi:hypothetical protein